MQIDKGIEFEIIHSNNKEDIGRRIKLMDILEEILDIKKLKTYRDVLEHRRECKKWNIETTCLECFGGGLTKFLENVKEELYRRKKWMKKK